MAGGPLGVLLRDQALESLRELAVAILAGVGPGLGQVQVTLVLERLGGGAVGDPVLLELVEVLGALQHHDHRGQAAGHPHGTVDPGHHRQRRGNRQLQQLQPLVAALVVATLAVVPADLVLQPVPGRVLCVWKGHGLDRPYRPCSVLAACHPPSLGQLRIPQTCVTTKLSNSASTAVFASGPVPTRRPTVPVKNGVFVSVASTTTRPFTENTRCTACCPCSLVHTACRRFFAFTLSASRPTDFNSTYQGAWSRSLAIWIESSHIVNT